MRKGNRLTKIVTRTGDEGMTSLVGGRRVSKGSLRVQAYGDVDELNSFLGLTKAVLGREELVDPLTLIQNQLFTIGSDLASPIDVEVPRATEEFIEYLDELIKELEIGLEPLREFILPGGCMAAGCLHVARAVARRAERNSVLLSEQEAINPLVLIYLNRLSDLLFIMARKINERTKFQEVMAEFSER